MLLCSKSDFRLCSYSSLGRIVLNFFFRVLPDRHTHDLRIHQLQVRVNGWEQVSPVSVDKVGTFFRYAAPDKNSSSSTVCGCGKDVQWQGCALAAHPQSQAVRQACSSLALVKFSFFFLTFYFILEYSLINSVVIVLGDSRMTQPYMSILPKTPLLLRLSYNTEQHSLCCTVGPCSLSTVNEIFSFFNFPSAGKNTQDYFGSVIGIGNHHIDKPASG